MLNTMGFKNDILDSLISKEDIDRRVKEMGLALTEEYRGKNPIFICVLKGSIHFFSDLTRSFEDYCELDFLSISSYGNARKTSGIVRLNKDLDMSITGRHVIIVEDIIDSGLTMNHLTSLLRARNPESIKIVTLLDKPERRECAITPDYVGFVIPNEYVVGYGLDYAGVYRNMPYVGILKSEVYGDESTEV
ncbi:MAG: hypoxanthine phosphoribosyltransferase [Christensenellaceae bacterium]|nr:hypoxanthine phosphoribosyltransferase [Christensenellaceae bacterium]